MITTPRKNFPLAFFAFLLLLDVTVYLLQKFASLQAAHHGSGFFIHLGMEPWAWIALAIGPIQLLIWTRILEHVDISLAYPLTSLAYPLTLLASQFILGESLHWQVWIGASLITLGSAIMGMSSNKTRISTAQPIIPAEQHP
ncbi:MAG TPA: hypothetical protein VGG19_09965 [Tepidisphaeraceae bacterium]|jgi:undecaprenyl phosphate-alpha-L-ara4N flippase subunit ArnE